MQPSIGSRSAALLLVVAAAVYGCAREQSSPTEPATQSAEETVNELSSRWVEAYNSGDLDALTKLYAEDASLHMPSAPAIWGRQAIRDYWRDDMAGGAQTELTITSAYNSGDLTYIEGTYRVKSADGTTLAGGDYVQLWRRNPNGWEIMNDNWHVHGVDYAPRTGNDLAQSLTSSWTAAYDSGDAAALGALYDEDAMVTMPGEATFTGRSDIETFWRDDIGSGDSTTELALRDAYVDGGLAHLEGTYRVLNRRDGSVLATGEYVQLWARERDAWRIHREMWSVNP